MSDVTRILAQIAPGDRQALGSGITGYFFAATAEPMRRVLVENTPKSPQPAWRRAEASRVSRRRSCYSGIKQLDPREPSHPPASNKGGNRAETFATFRNLNRIRR